MICRRFVAWQLLSRNRSNVLVILGPRLFPDVFGLSFVLPRCLCAPSLQKWRASFMCMHRVFQGYYTIQLMQIKQQYMLYMLGCHFRLGDLEWNINYVQGVVQKLCVCAILRYVPWFDTRRSSDLTRESLASATWTWHTNDTTGSHNSGGWWCVSVNNYA